MPKTIRIAADDARKQGTILERSGFVAIVALLRLFAVLPYGLVARLGSALGAMLYALPSSRKHIVLVNLRLCFPGKSEPTTMSLRETTFAMSFEAMSNEAFNGLAVRSRY
jgi:lauroyl/myristoyl acyltransferase